MAPPLAHIFFRQLVIPDNTARLSAAGDRPAGHKIRLFKFRQFPLPQFKHRPGILAPLYLSLGPILRDRIVTRIARGVEIGVAP